MIRVNKLIPMSVVDGPGNRFAIFLQGCPFDCKYCHNPETIHLCNHCGACVVGCPARALTLEEGTVHWDPRLCIDCDRCIALCPRDASPKIRNMTAEEIVGEVEKAVPFIEGISVSGGEATLQARELIPLFRKVKEMGLTALIDSNGGLDFSQGHLKQLLDISDGVMLDIKAWEEEDHRRIVGRDNKQVKRNLAYLAARDKLEEVRFVLLEDLENEHTLRSTAEVLGEKICSVRAKLISYRPYGVRREYTEELRAPDREEKERLLEIAEALGFSEVVDI